MARKARNPRDSAASEFMTKVRERYRRANTYWKDIRDEAATDMRYITGDPWSETDKRERRAANRPMFTSDELNQYTNQAINQWRQNKRGIVIKPRGEGSNDETATVNQDIIRAIEYNSNAQQAAYIPAIENQIQRSYGFFRLTRRYIGDSFKQECVIKGISNPDSVLFDPHVKESDWSDAEYVFVLNPMEKSEYERKYPNASLVGFQAADEDMTSDWVRSDLILTAEYWEITRTPKKKYLIESEQGELELWEDELPKDFDPESASQMRTVETKSVTQYIVNGIETLEKNPQPGTIIPIFAVLGKEMWIPDAVTSKRKIFSMIRLARDPYMKLCWINTLEGEALTLIPKTGYVGAVGQFKTDKDAWDTAHQQPHSYLQYDVVIDEVTGTVLPPPQRQIMSIDANTFEISKESARRAIQAALGLFPATTATQRRNDKSGVALERIQSQEQLGSFHFQDNSDRALQLCGRVLLEWIPEVYNDEREMQVPQQDRTMRLIRINTDQPYEGENGQPEHYKVAEDLDHAVIVDTGPSFESQRQAADDFLQLLVSNLAAIPVDAPTKAKLLSLAIKLKDLGPLGTEMAEVISPDDPNAPQVYAQKLQQSQQQLQAINAYAQQLEAEIQKLNLEKQGKVIDNEYKARIEEMKLQAQITVAEIETKAQNAMQRAQWELDMWKETHGAAHESALSAQEHQQTQAQAQQAAENAQVQAQQPAQQPQEGE